MTLAEGGVLLDRYELIGKLGQGGYGVVYEALDRSSGERIALKELTRVNPLSLAQFKQEFRVVQEIHHPNLARLDALFEERGQWLIAMELVAGKDLLSHLYVDGAERYFDEADLRAAFGQLAAGLQALHAAGIVHRDLKPANVRVTPEGRVVLLDFGLATTIDPRARGAPSSGFGTVAYMSPEQADNANVGPETDFYALGVCLYEALTGVLPIDAESPGALLAAKHRPHTHSARSQAPGIPDDLDRLCDQLLAPDWHQRPGAREVRDVLAKGARLPSLKPTFRQSSLEGRERELAVLERAWSLARAGSVQVVLVEGESGIGKTALVDHFLAQAQQPLILRSRCYENELVAYKAFDGAIEELAQLLMTLSASECEALLPPRAAVLCRLFPALESVRALAETPLTGLAADPSVQRIEAFSIFARLLAGLSERTPIVLAIDDLQWADAESFRMLQALLDALPARCLILASVRPRAELDGDAEAEIAALRSMSCVRELPLLGLPRPSALALARSLMGSNAPSAWLELIVKESAGHPLFITVLARFIQQHPPSGRFELTLDLAISSQIDGLSPKSRSLLETVAVVASPLSAVMCGRSAGLPEGELGGIVTELCQQRLLRRRRAGEIACFHDRIRRVAAAGLSPEQAKNRHGQLARTLASQRKIDAAQLARHYEAAGELSLALAAYRQSAEQAMGALAFGRAAALYARALGIAQRSSLSDPERLRLHVDHGDCLARSGRSQDAAREYRAAASIASGEQKLRLRLLVAEHLLQGASITEGKRAARSLLHELGVSMPRGSAGTLARLLWDRAWVGVRGLAIRGDGEQMDWRRRMQLDALWGLALPLVWVDPLASTALITRHLRLSRELSDRTHLARALAQEAFARAIRDTNRPDIDELMGQARALSGQSGDPALEMNVSYREGTIAVLRWQVTHARERLENAHRIGIERCPDQPWLLTNIRISLGPLYVFMGEHARQAASSAAWLAEARARDDRFALSLIETTGLGGLRHLMADDPAAARASIADAMAPWPRHPFSFAHFGEILAVTLAELYRGGAGAHLWLEREEPRLARTLMLKLRYGKATWLGWRSLAKVAAYCAGGRQNEQLLRELHADVHVLNAFGMRFTSLTSASIEAQLAVLEGNLARARTLLSRARDEAERHDSLFLARCLQYLQASIEPRDDGASTRREILAFFRSQGWKNPRRAVAILCPAISAVERGRIGARDSVELTTA